MQLINLEETLKLEEERKNRIFSLITNNNLSISTIESENLKLCAELKIIREELIDNTNMMDQETRINKEWRDAEIGDNIIENKKILQTLIQEQKKLSEYITFNKNYINSLEYSIRNLDSEIKAKDIETKLQKKRKRVYKLSY